MAILKLENISKSFGERKLFHNLTMELEAGKVYTLMGANGSGKTTLFNIITGFVKADAGKVTFNNHLLNSKLPAGIHRLGITRTFQDLRLINGLTVRENILLVLDKKMFHFTEKAEYEKVENILNQVSLDQVGDNLGSDLSYGQQKLLTMGCCLANNPKLLLFDEPVAGVDNENQEKIKQIILNLKHEGKTILQIEHNQKYINETSDIILYLDMSGIKTL
jgi:branched-chain amino acid transport system ATP-binding protein